MSYAFRQAIKNILEGAAVGAVSIATYLVLSSGILSGMFEESPSRVTDVGPILGITAEGSPFCSAAFIDKEKSLFLTAKHCVKGEEDNYNITYVKKQGAEVVSSVTYTAKLVATHEGGDLAILRADDKDVGIKPLSIAKRDPKQGDEVTIIGTPLSEWNIMSKGHVSGLNLKGPTGKEFMAFDLNVVFGNSGGPVLDENGDVISVVSYVRVASNGFQAFLAHQLSGGAPTPVVRKFVEDVTERANYRYTYILRY